MSRDFWSRRRAAVEAESQAQAQALSEAELAAQEAALAAREDDEILAELELPAPETLETPEAVRNFLKSALPMRLRNRALRQLWGMNPTLANLDGLVDYADDYTDAAMVVPDMKTTYQVGKGMLAHVQEMARQAEALTKTPEEAEVVAEAVVEEPDNAEVEAEATQDMAVAAVETDTAQDDTPLPPRRRMRFQFDDQPGVSA